MRRFLLLLLAITALVTPALAQYSSAVEGDPTGVVQVYALQAAFHGAASSKNLDLMMSLWADDATFAIGGQTYRGKDQIRAWFANVAGSFRPENNWVSLAPTHKIRVNVQGDRATLSFECHYVDVATKALRSQITAETTLVRVDGKWVIKDLKAGTASLP